MSAARAECRCGAERPDGKVPVTQAGEDLGTTRLGQEVKLEDPSPPDPPSDYQTPAGESRPKAKPKRRRKSGGKGST